MLTDGKYRQLLRLEDEDLLYGKLVQYLFWMRG